jgi:hypothetical protein
MCIRFGSRFDFPCVDILTIHGDSLRWIDSWSDYSTTLLRWAYVYRSTLDIICMTEEYGLLCWDYLKNMSSSRNEKVYWCAVYLRSTVGCVLVAASSITMAVCAVLHLFTSELFLVTFYCIQHNNQRQAHQCVQLLMVVVLNRVTFTSLEFLTNWLQMFRSW